MVVINQPVLQDLLSLTKNKLNQKVVDYLRNRDIKKQSADIWEIGYLPDQDLLQELNDLPALRKLSILTRGDFSPLHRYVTFPLYDQHNQLIGMSGRTLVEGQKKRKYWHSVIPKRRFLFGLDKAKQGIRDKGYAIVGEGQFDVITSHQHGIDNVVGTMGTALTPDQVSLLARYADTIYIIFDNDPAGRKALETQLQRHKRDGVRLIPILLPEQGQDIDSYIRKHGKDNFLSLLQSTPPQEMDV
jgi:DNA primase